MKGVKELSLNRYDTLSDEYPYEYVIVAITDDGTRIVRRMFTAKTYDEAEQDLRMRVEQVIERKQNDKRTTEQALERD